MSEGQSQVDHQAPNLIPFTSKVFLLSGIGGFYLLGLNLLSGVGQSWLIFLQGWVFSLSVIGISTALFFIFAQLREWRIIYLIIAILFLFAWILYFLTSNTFLAWILLSLSLAIIIRIDDFLTRDIRRTTSFIVHGLIAFGVGIGIIVTVQIESHFAEEEFFTAIQALVISGYWLVLLALDRFLIRKKSIDEAKNRPLTRPLLIGVIGLFLTGLVITILAYQRSFYPSEAPGFSEISQTKPFLCGSVVPDDQAYMGEDVFKDLIQTLAANPNKSSPEFGMLALGTGEEQWAEQFKDSLLSEARHANYTLPAGSVKYGQYLAAFRVYYYARVKQRFPDLFSPSESEELEDWFAAINRRVLTTELVDWMYAIAFSKLPDGPYENQETGTGLLALLETYGLADPGSSLDNRAYLEQNLSGWTKRFSNTDDAAVYQPEWINNVLYQSIYSGDPISENERLSFEWLLLQALPSGAPLRYNHVGSANFGKLGYLGAILLGDERFIWLSGRALEYLNENGRPLAAQPGVEESLPIVGRSPRQGSCLLYGDSGLPNQVGPLAPDKIVFRDGWARDSAYLLLNLRFTGWHRYKATNTITLIYQDELLSADQMTGETFTWLPEGRSLFRDKRIPRENLNGLVIGKVGLSKVLNALTGLGSPWAQDPPYYALVKEFTTQDNLDTSTTVLDDWHGWTHERNILFYHDGPIVVKDEAWGPSRQNVALNWNLVSDGRLTNERLKLRSGKNPAEVVFLKNENGEFQTTEFHSSDDEAPNLQVQYALKDDGHLSLITIFLMNEWVGAQAQLVESPDGIILEIWNEDEKIQIPL